MLRSRGIDATMRWPCTSGECNGITLLHVKLLVLGSSSYSIGLVNDHAHNRLAYCSAANERMRVANLKLQFSENNIGNWLSLWSNYKALQFKEYLQFHSSVCAWWTSWNFLFPHIYSTARELFSLKEI